MLMIQENDVNNLISIDDALKAVESSFLEQANGTGINLPRQRLRQPAGTLHLMGAALTHRGYWGFKSYTTTKTGARFSINLYNLETGSLLAIIEANLLGQLRTGAASGIASKYLSRHDSTTMAVFGSGFQANTQILAIMKIRNLQQIKIFSPNTLHREQFAREMDEKVPAKVIAVSTAEEAINNADIITTITASSTPVFSGALISNGIHINAAGANSLIRSEIDSDTIRKIDTFFTDDINQAKLESGNLLHAYERNVFTWDQLIPLAEVVAGNHPGRQSPDEKTLFESHGIALWDIALAADVYELAIRGRYGVELPFLP